MNVRTESIKLDDAREVVWRILGSMGYNLKHNDRLREEVDAVLDDYSTIEEHGVQNAEWVALDDCMGVCSNCMSLGCFSKYCPNCGRRMVNGNG